MQILTINMHWLFNLFKDAHGNYKKVVSSHGERSRWRKSIDKKLISWQGKGGGTRGKALWTQGHRPGWG